MSKYIERYEDALNRVEFLKNAGERLQKVPAMGFTSNFDVVLKWDVRTYNKILATFLSEENSAKEMKSIEDFVQITSSYIAKGLGGNFDILSKNLCSFLNREFKSEFSLGGTCAQAAAALGSLGIPSHIHLTDKSGEVCKLLDYPGITSNVGDKRVAIREIKSEELPIYHYILQFSKDDELYLGEEVIKIPCSNRLILFFDKVQKSVPIQIDYMRYVEKHATSFSSYLISGFDAIVDIDLMKDKAMTLGEHLKRVKSKNPNIILYYENAFYMNQEVNAVCLEYWGSQVDIVGLNEEELQMQIKTNEKHLSMDCLENILYALKSFRKHYKVKGVVLHSKDYALYYGEKLKNIDIELGLTVGNLMSSTRARTGKYGDVKECELSLSLQLSSKGLELYKEIEHIDLEDSLVFVPTKYMEHPKYTIGLGDTFTAGVMTSFI